MPASIRALLADDDDFFRRAFAARLRIAVPEVELTDRATPDVSGQFDVYFLDNHFAAVPLAGDLVATARLASPTALIIALSGHLDADTLRRLINEGCNGAVTKGDTADMARCFEVVRAYAANLAPKPVGLGRTLRSITDLIREWNARLDKNLAAEVR